MTKVRVLFPLAFRNIVEGDDPEGGAVINVPAELVAGLVAAGYAETVERATKAPGEKRDVRRPAKKAEG